MILEIYLDNIKQKTEKGDVKMKRGLSLLEKLLCPGTQVSITQTGKDLVGIVEEIVLYPTGYLEKLIIKDGDGELHDARICGDITLMKPIPVIRIEVHTPDIEPGIKDELNVVILHDSTSVIRDSRVKFDASGIYYDNVRKSMIYIGGICRYTTYTDIDSSKINIDDILFKSRLKLLENNIIYRDSSQKLLDDINSRIKTLMGNVPLIVE